MPSCEGASPWMAMVTVESYGLSYMAMMRAVVCVLGLEIIIDGALLDLTTMPASIEKHVIVQAGILFIVLNNACPTICLQVKVKWLGLRKFLSLCTGPMHY